MFQWIEKHIEGLLVAAFGVCLAIGAVAWIQEHDARILAEQTVKASQSRVEDLQKSITQVDQSTKTQIAALQKKAATVKTPVQAVQAIPELSDIPLNAHPAIGFPDAVMVDAVPLFQELNKCKQDSVELSACSTKLGLEQKIDTEKDVQITALKKKPGFWKQVKDTSIKVGIGVAIAYALHR